jgi:sugar phosphate isomerase/epimerase
MAGMNRREFIATAGKGVAAAGILAASGATLGADPLGIPIGSQTYPVRARILAGEFVQVLKDMHAAGIRQIELCSPGYREFASLADGKQTKKIIEDNGLKCISAHFSFASEFRDTLPKSIQWAQDVGLTQMGTASLPANMGTAAAPIITMSGGVTSEESIKRAADAYGKIGQQTKAAGIQLFLHNEAFENSRTNDGRLTYPILLSALDPDLVKMQFQMSSMRTIGNPITYFNLYPGRFISAHVHGVDLTGTPPAGRGPQMPIKPTPEELAAQAARQARAGGAGGGGARAGGAAGAPPAPTGPMAVPVGEDSVNWQAVFTAAKIGGLKNYFIEQEQPNGGWEAMVKGAAYLKTLNVT